MMLAATELKGNTHGFHCLEIFVMSGLHLSKSHLHWSKSRLPLSLWNEPGAEGRIPAHPHCPVCLLPLLGSQRLPVSLSVTARRAHSNALHPGTYVA